MKLDDFELYRDIIKNKTGWALTPDKSYAIESRLVPLLDENNLDSLSELTSRLRKEVTPELISMIVEALANSETFFFRDQKPFEYFRNTAIPALNKANTSKAPLRILSIGCATGQEPYSIAILSHEMGMNFEIIAADISKNFLKKADDARYTQAEAQRGVPAPLLIKHFKQDNGTWHLNDSIKKLVQFRQFNVMDDCASLGTFDVIFCRNVLNAFDNESKMKTLLKLAECLKHRGFLFVGTTEAVLAPNLPFRAIPGERGIYMRS